MNGRGSTRAGSAQAVVRWRLRVNGIVQGVGFRPFVYRLAEELQLAGFVSNDAEGVLIEIEGPESRLLQFSSRLESDLPPLAKIITVKQATLAPLAETEFRIEASSHDQAGTTLVAPDIATCPDCLAELFDKSNRRYRYPFINCTNCGPRYTIVERIPYDRPNTSMKVFPMCPECRGEYENPANRRFHAQPNACPVCGPGLTLHDGTRVLPVEDPIDASVRLLQEGKILAVRGVGGFHLAVDPFNEQAVEMLRSRKGRAEKPFALMAQDVGTVRKYCLVSDEEEALLLHSARPIVLLRKIEECAIPEQIAPGNKYLGFMLAYTPLHHLLLCDHFDTLVMTSANYSEEPIAIGNEEAIERLKNVADAFLLHDREILQRCDDSVARVEDGRLWLIRRSRGFVPTPIFINRNIKPIILGCGAELKNTIALSRGNEVFFSQHIGDLDNPQALGFFEHSIKHLADLLEIKADLIAHDMHPEYLSTKWAKMQPLPGVGVQHHHAHLASVMTENERAERTIGIILDGTGYGADGTVWGGEVLIGDLKSFDRFAWLAPVPMPGGTAAIKQPWRMAWSYLYRLYGSDFVNLDLPVVKQLPVNQRQVILQMIEQGINSPMTSSCGRLFDAVAALCGIRSEVSFEAQAAIELEVAAMGHAEPPRSMPFSEIVSGPLDTSDIVQEVVRSAQEGILVGRIAAQFHCRLADLFVATAQTARIKTDIATVALSGGVYQNRYFTKYLLDRLRAAKFTVLQHRELPVNDSSIALGQIAIAAAQMESE